MNTDDQKKEIIGWLQKVARRDEASVEIRSDDDTNEAEIVANPDGLLLLAAELISASMRIKKTEYLKDVEKNDIKEETILPQWLINSSLRIDEPNEDEESIIEKNNSWVSVFIFVLIFVALLVIGYLYIVK